MENKSNKYGNWEKQMPESIDKQFYYAKLNLVIMKHMETYGFRKAGFVHGKTGIVHFG